MAYVSPNIHYQSGGDRDMRRLNQLGIQQRALSDEGKLYDDGRKFWLWHSSDDEGSVVWGSFINDLRVDSPCDRKTGCCTNN